MRTHGFEPRITPNRTDAQPCPVKVWESPRPKEQAEAQISTLRDLGVPGYLFAGRKDKTEAGRSQGGGGDGPPAVVQPSGLGLSPGQGARYLRSAGRGSLGGPVPA